MLQNSFDRVVRTGSAAFHAFAQNSTDLFRREKPEGVVARRTGPTICHGTKHRVEFARRTGCLGECSTSVNHGCFSETCFPRRRSARIGPIAPLGHTPAVSNTGSPFFLARKIGQCRRSGYCPEASTSCEIHLLWSENRPARNRISKRPTKLRCCHAHIRLCESRI